MKNIVDSLFVLFVVVGLSVNVYANGALDSDNDGLTDVEEIFTFSSERMVNTYTADYQWFPDISSNGSSYMVVWQSNTQDGLGFGVYMQMLDLNGNKISSEILVNSFTTENQSTGAVSTDGENYFVVWQSDMQDGSDYGIFGKFYNSSGNVSEPEFQINSYTTAWQANPCVAYNGENYLVVWQSYGNDGDGSGVFGQLVGPAGDKIGGELQINTYTTGHQWVTDVKTDGNNFLVLWYCSDQDGDGSGVFAQLLDNDGNKIDAEFQVNSYTADNQKEASAASDGSTYFVAWESENQDSSQSGVFGQLFDTDGTKIGLEFQINSYTMGSQESPKVSSNGHRYLVTWHSIGQDSDLSGIYAQLFDSAGNKIGDETLVNTYTTGNQKYPNVTSDGHNFALVWHSFAQDGDLYGVVSKISAGYGTDYLNSDTDNDGMNDGFEVQNNLDPFVDDSSDDLDDDGLSNIDESNNGTDPTNPDTDNDGLTDGMEVNQIDTDPLNPDTDDDGMDDGDEVYVGMEPDNADSLFSIKSITLNDSLNNTKIMWYGSVLTDIDYKVLWSDYPWVNWYETEADNSDIINNGGIRSWVDEGDNEAVVPRSNPANNNQRFYKVIVE